MVASTPVSEHKKLAVTIGTSGHDTNCMRISHGTLKDAATISFQRTLRVPDNQVVNNLPPSLGQFPLFSVADYKNRMPEEMARKGGVFLPMYQREAMWIKFFAKEPFALKVYVGGVNAISGIPIKESPEATLQRLQLSDKVKQDYVVLPEQPWLDGIASDDGRIRQFVAMPKGSGYSVEAQVTGEEKIDGMQFELTPMKRVRPESLNVKVFEGSRYTQSPSKQKLLKFQEKTLNDTSTMLDLKKVIAAEFGLAVLDQELSLVISNHKVGLPNMNDDQLTIAEIWLPEFSVLEVRNKRAISVEDGLVSRRAGGSSSTHSAAYGVKMKMSAAVPVYALGWFTPGKMYSKNVNMMEYTASRPASAVPLPSPLPASIPISAVFNDTASPQAARSRQSAGPATAPGQAHEPAPPVQIQAMSLAAGGLIQQSINADTYPTSIWDFESTIMFNIQLLNSESFIEVTGRAPPISPIDAKTYQQHGYPFFEIWNEELSGVKGDFTKVKSVGEMDVSLAKAGSQDFWEKLTGEGTKGGGGKKDEEFKRDEPLKFPVVMLDMSLSRTFKPIKQMEEEARKLKATA